MECGINERGCVSGCIIIHSCEGGKLISSLPLLPLPIVLEDVNALIALYVNGVVLEPNVRGLLFGRSIFVDYILGMATRLKINNSSSIECLILLQVYLIFTMYNLLITMAHPPILFYLRSLRFRPGQFCPNL